MGASNPWIVPPPPSAVDETDSPRIGGDDAVGYAPNNRISSRSRSSTTLEAITLIASDGTLDRSVTASACTQRRPVMRALLEVASSALP